jgi:hypothetical protein
MRSNRTRCDAAQHAQHGACKYRSAAAQSANGASHALVVLRDAYTTSLQLMYKRRSRAHCATPIAMPASSVPDCVYCNKESARE